jgi:hypothetical protein
VVIPLRGGTKSWEFGYYDKAVCSILLMTDGVFDYAHPPVLGTPYNKFVMPFLRARYNQEEDISGMTGELVKLFSEGELYERITDDKTLVGVINNDFLLPDLSPEDIAEPDWAEIQERQRKALYEPRDNEVHEIPESTADKTDGGSFVLKRVGAIYSKFSKIDDGKKRE